MTGQNTDWEQRVDRLWATMDGYDEDDFVATMANLVDELPSGDPVGLFERAASLDSTGPRTSRCRCTGRRWTSA